MRREFFRIILIGMKKITLCAINARYSHSSLALLCLKHAAVDPDIVTTAEYNINDSPAAIAEEIIKEKPDVAGFSCYIWNIEHVIKVASVVKKVLPHCVILLGGPEVSYDCKALMQRWPFVDIIISGAGEIPFAKLTASLSSDCGIEATPSAFIRTQQGIIETAKAEPYDFASQPFLYHDLSAFENRMIYYETSRGCPFRCAYCMSAGERLSFLPTRRVAEELELFMKANVRQVKLVDRTFNHPDSRAREIWHALIALKQKYPQSMTNFHFEVSASLLSEETIALLRQAPQGLIQLEIGIQSTHDETLIAVRRAHDTQKLLQNTRALCQKGNLRVYIDLIAGLPYESVESFACSFNDAYSLSADRLQLGFLKLLPGSHLRAEAEKYGIVFTPHAPYEVLKTNTMSYEHLRHLHRMEQVLDVLYNQRQAIKTLEQLIPSFESAYDFFDSFTGYLTEDDFFSRPQPKQAIFEKLLDFGEKLTDKDKLNEALAFDWLCLQKPNVWPNGISVPQYNSMREFCSHKDSITRYLPHYSTLRWRDIERRCLIVSFETIFDSPVLALFDYGKARDDAGFVQIVG